jgi:hypothetical protein
VNDAAGVGIGHRLANLLEDLQPARQVRVGVAAPGQERGQGLPLDQLHGEVGPPVGELSQLVDRHHARVLQLAANLRFLDEAADDFGPVLVFVLEHLDSQVAAEVRVAPPQHRPHAAAADLAQELVAPGRPRRGSLRFRGAGRGPGAAQAHAGDLVRSGGGGEGARGGRAGTPALRRIDGAVRPRPVGTGGAGGRRPAGGGRGVRVGAGHDNLLQVRLLCLTPASRASTDSGRRDGRAR